MISDKHLTELNNLMSVKNFTPDTKKNYKSQIVKFGCLYGSQYTKATIVELVKYISEIENTNYMASTYSALKFFYTIVLKQPKKFPFIPFPRKESRLKNIPTKQKILSAIDKTENVKHRLIITLLYGTGIRLSELIGIKWKDIRREQSDLNPLSILIHGKGNKDRLVPISSRLNELLKQYCKEYELNCKTNSEHYILGNEKPYSKRAVANVVKSAGEKVGIDLHPHLLRHACFTHLRDSGIDLAAIQELAGHLSAKTTMQYAKLNPVKIEMPI